MSRDLPSELIARQAERLGRGSADPVALAAELNGELERRVVALVAQLRGGSGTGSAADLAPYRARAWQCVVHHVERFLESRAMSFPEVLDHLEKGQLAYGPVGVNVLAEVVLAQGLEQGEPAAARRFESDYMPAVRLAARKVGGERAIDAVDNFAAELVLPREDRASRLSTFVGRTPLATWLRTVVVNYWITQTRRERYERPGEIPEISQRERPDHQVEGRPCREMLTPVFRRATHAVPAEDRLLLKLLLIDGVPQKDVARALQLNSGTVTRRRQKAAEQVLQAVQTEVARSGRSGPIERCLELALAGESPELRAGLAEMLALAVGESEQTGSVRRGAS